ncbi:hypothetical protein [Streptomyces sp. NPDC048611]|uniref:hypothetical protein n=1 Tax=Streptomyces sp. NPDC048611 TaxID=3155635 RepID=UPI003444AADC
MTQPVPLVVTRHQCPHCGRTWAKKAAATAHITRCWRNPATRSCKTCRHFAPPEEGPYPEHPGWPEQCDEGRSLTGGLHTGCPLWAALTQTT